MASGWKTERALIALTRTPIGWASWGIACMISWFTEYEYQKSSRCKIFSHLSLLIMVSVWYYSFVKIKSFNRAWDNPLRFVIFNHSSKILLFPFHTRVNIKITTKQEIGDELQWRAAEEEKEEKKIRRGRKKPLILWCHYN